MEQLKFSIGPYELFSSIIAGVPLSLAAFILYYPISSLRDLIPTIKNNSSFSILITLVMISYIIGGIQQGFTWQYFKITCNLLKKDYGHIGTSVMEKLGNMTRDEEQTNVGPLSFEGQVAALLVKKIGTPDTIAQIDERLMPYIRKRDFANASAAESYLAIHIMYRNLSFGFLVLTLVLVINIFRVQAHNFEQYLLPLLCAVASYVSLSRSVAFRRWRFREIILSFYYLANEEVLNNNDNIVGNMNDSAKDNKNNIR